MAIPAMSWSKRGGKSSSILQEVDVEFKPEGVWKVAEVKPLLLSHEESEP
jgi:hypothetical protein